MEKIKIAAVLTICAALIAGCGQAPAAASPAAPADTVMITAPSGDITFEDYRTYIDVSEAVSRHNARKQFAVYQTLIRDLSELNLGSQEERLAEAGLRLDEIAAGEESFDKELAMIADAAGLTVEQAKNAALVDICMEYMTEDLGAHLTEEASAEYVETEPDPAETEGLSEEEAELYKEQKKSQEIYMLAYEKMSEYSAAMNDRLSFESEGLAMLDGEELPYTDEANAYIGYCAAAARLDTVAFIQQCELARRDIAARGWELDEEAIAADIAANIEAMRADTEYLEEMSGILEDIGMTVEEYIAGMEKPLWLEAAMPSYYELISADYSEMAEQYEQDSGSASEPLISPDEYYVQSMEKLLEGSEIVNITGK